ncbi:hypothetical protein M0802_007965 [Mischocyttarus mexicanus]|nr:hypothetical protein M0802_007965 [Mischocyttarus mexicanus]
MTNIKSCWSPCVWTNSIKSGCKVVSYYTVALCIILIILICYQMNGGDSTQLYNPLFEADIRGSLQIVGGTLICYLTLLAASAVMMMYGLYKGVRGFLIPWLCMWFIMISFLCVFGLWLLGGYYIYLESVFAALCIWLWMGYNIYCWLIVYTMYKIFEELQSPNIELLWP